MENLRKHRGIKLVTTEKRRNYLVLEPNHDSTKYFTETLLVLEIKKTKIVMNKSVNLSLSIIWVYLWDLVWLFETKVWRKNKIMFHWYRPHYGIHKNQRHLCREPWRYWNMIWYFKLKIEKKRYQKVKKRLLA